MVGVLAAKALARRSYDAINRGDVAAFMANWRDDGRLTYPGNLSVSGTHKGKQEIETWFRHFMEAIPTRTFRPISISVQNVFDLFGNNVIPVQWDNRPVNKAGQEYYVRGVTVSTVRWGKITESITYVFDYDLLPSLWGEEPSLHHPWPA